MQMLFGGPPGFQTGNPPSPEIMDAAKERFLAEFRAGTKPEITLYEVGGYYLAIINGEAYAGGTDPVATLSAGFAEYLLNKPLFEAFSDAGIQPFAAAKEGLPKTNAEVVALLNQGPEALMRQFGGGGFSGVDPAEADEIDEDGWDEDEDEEDDLQAQLDDAQALLDELRDRISDRNS